MPQPSPYEIPGHEPLRANLRRAYEFDDAKGGLDVRHEGHLRENASRLRSVAQHAGELLPTVARASEMYVESVAELNRPFMASAVVEQRREELVTAQQNFAQGANALMQLQHEVRYRGVDSSDIERAALMMKESLTAFETRGLVDELKLSTKHVAAMERIEQANSLLLRTQGEALNLDTVTGTARSAVSSLIPESAKNEQTPLNDIADSIRRADDQLGDIGVQQLRMNHDTLTLNGMYFAAEEFESKASIARTYVTGELEYELDRTISAARDDQFRLPRGLEHFASSVSHHLAGMLETLDQLTSSATGFGRAVAELQEEASHNQVIVDRLQKGLDQTTSLVTDAAANLDQLASTIVDRVVAEESRAPAEQAIYAHLRRQLKAGKPVEGVDNWAKIAPDRKQDALRALTQRYVVGVAFGPEAVGLVMAGKTSSNPGLTRAAARMNEFYSKAKDIPALEQPAERGLVLTK